MSVLSLKSLCLADNDSPSSAEDLDLEDKWDTDLEVDGEQAIILTFYG